MSATVESKLDALTEKMVRLGDTLEDVQQRISELAELFDDRDQLLNKIAELEEAVEDATEWG